MIVALFPNITKKHSKNLAVGIREYLTSRDIEGQRRAKASKE